MNFEQMVGRNFEAAAKILDAAIINIGKDQLMPVAFVFREGKIVTIATPFQTGHEKEIAADAVRDACKDADLLIYLHEAYVLVATEAEAAEHGGRPLKNHPRRTEALIVLVETKETSATGIGELTGAMPNRKVGDLRWHRTQEGGLFVNLLCLPRGLQ